MKIDENELAYIRSIAWNSALDAFESAIIMDESYFEELRYEYAVLEEDEEWVEVLIENIKESYADVINRK